MNAFGLTVLACLGKNSSLQEAVMAVLRTLREQLGSLLRPSALAARHHHNWRLPIWSASGTTIVSRQDVLCLLLILPRHTGASG